MSFLLFALFTGALAAGAVHFGHDAVRRARLGEYAGAERWRLRTLSDRLRGRVDSIRERIRAAERLAGASARGGNRNRNGNRTRRALAYILEGAGGGAGGSGSGSFAAAALLDTNGRVVDSRARGRAPAGTGRLWARARRSPLLRGRARGGFDIQPAIVSGAPVAILLTRAGAAGRFWGVIVPAASLLPVRSGEMAGGDIVFVLAEPGQQVLFARWGNKFLADEIAAPFKGNLGTVIEVASCCNPRAFNAANMNARWMTETRLPAGARQLRLVRVADRTGRDIFPDKRLTLLLGFVAGCWVLALLWFAFSGRRRRAAAHLTAEGEEADAFAPALVRNPSREDSPARLEVLSRVSESVAAGAEYRAVLAAITEEVARFVSTDRFYAALYDEGLDRFHEVAASKLGEDYRAAMLRPSSELPERVAIQEKEIVEVTSLDAWRGAPGVLRRENVQAALAFPLIARGRVVGVASFHFAEPREVPDDEVDYCALLLQQGAIAISAALPARSGSGR